MQSQAKLFRSDFFFSKFLFVKSLSEHLPLPQGQGGRGSRAGVEKVSDNYHGF